LSGNELEQKIFPINLYKNINGIIICSSYDNKESLYNLYKWIHYIKKFIKVEINNNKEKTTDNGEGKFFNSNINKIYNQIIPLFVIFNKYDINIKDKKFTFNEAVKIMSENLKNENFTVFDKVSVNKNLNINCVFEKMSKIFLGLETVNETKLSQSFNSYEILQNSRMSIRMQHSDYQNQVKNSFVLKKGLETKSTSNCC
jgi:hypothetical protein